MPAPSAPNPANGLPDEAVVVRFGGADSDWTARAENDAITALDRPGGGRLEISLWCAVPADDTEPSLREATRLACDESRLGYRWIRVARARDLRAVGLSFRWDSAEAAGSPYHWNLALSSVDQVEVALQWFRDPEENPTWPKYRRFKR